MRRIFAICLGVFCLAAIAGCSRTATPPVGRWEGTYDVGDTIVAARLEITAKGEIFVSAPNAENIGGVTGEDRAAIRKRLADGMEEGWGGVQARPMEFDGETFRRPGGIAPQAEWNSSSKQMTLIVYLGKGEGVRIPLRAVKAFSPDPFSGA